MRSGKQADFARDRTDIRLAPAVGPLALQNHLADDFLLDLVQHAVEHHRVHGGLRFSGRSATFRRLRVSRSNLIEERVDGVVSLLLADDRLQHHQLVMDLRFDLLVEAGVQLHDRRLFLHRHLGLEFLDHRDDLLDGLVRLLDPLGNHALGQLLGADLDHVDGFLRATDQHVQVAAFKLLVRGIDDEFPIDPADPAGPQRPQEGNLADRQRCTGANQSRDIGVVFTIGAHHGSGDLHFVEVTVREQRANRPVNVPRRKNLFGRGSSLPFDETAGEFARGTLLLTVIDTQGEETHFARGSRGSHHRGDQHDRLPVRHQHRSIGLLGDPTRFQGQRPAADLSRNTMYICHFPRSFTDSTIPALSRGPRCQ